MPASGPLVIRVGLASDLRAVTLPCCDRRLTLLAGDLTLPLTAATRVMPAATLATDAVYRLQVAALKDEQQARGIAEYVARSTGLPADSVFDAGTDLYRVRVGRFASREDAEASRGLLARFGIDDGWVASEGGDLQDPAFEIIRGEEKWRVPGRWLEIAAPKDLGIPFGEGRYRGRLLLFLNNRGHLNVVNEIEIEDYLRGVVPKEMGPELYPQLAALKAQTVAARTYAVRNLGEFAEEGYDICSTPRCQVYGGMAIEHPRSDQAIAETVGQVVLFEGRPAETFYGATCGGHTENVEVVFPLKRGAYLRGVPCMEAGIGRLSGDLRSGTPFPAGLMRRLLPPAADERHRVLAGRMEHLALLAGLPVPRDRLRSMRRGEVLRFATSVYDLVLDRRLRWSPKKLALLLDDPPPDWRQRDHDLAAYLVASGRREGEVGDSEAEDLLFHLAMYVGVLERHTARYLKLEDGALTVRSAGATRIWELADGLATFRRRGDKLAAAPLELMAGDPLELYRFGERWVAAVQPVDAPTVSVSLGGRVPKQRWSRFKTADQLRTTVQARYPGFPFEDFEILSRGVSGRVAKLRLLGSGGRSQDVEGLAVRWTLDVWDTLFEVKPTHIPGRGAGWTFHGRGWGHGVGMCQAGAFGMALRGASYRAILEHYYTGIELGRLKPAPQRPRIASM